MTFFSVHRQTALRIGTLLLALLVCGCAGLEPYEPRNYREEGLEQGLFTGPEGEWVIYRGDRIRKKQNQKTDEEKTDEENEQQQ